MRALLALLAALPLHGAVIRGSVVENLTGKPVMRSVVVLQPVAGTPGATRSVRTDRFGSFAFHTLSGGMYVLQVSRPGFMPVEYGQKRWNSAGIPIVVGEPDATFLNIRMRRHSAISGFIVDENDIGLPDHEVVAYRNTRPPDLAARTVTDDRGGYRIHGLEPGTYTVRTVGRQYPEGGYLPTFSKETDLYEQARRVELFVEEEAVNVEVRPRPGQLFTLNVSVLLASPPPVTVTLASDTGRRIAQGAAVSFPSLPPGQYDLYAELDIGQDNKVQIAYERVGLVRDTSIVLQELNPIPMSLVDVRGGPPNDWGRVLLRHKDLAGAGNQTVLRVTRGRAMISPGRWEMILEPPSGYYVSSFYGPGMLPRGGKRPDVWNEVVTNGMGAIRFDLASGPGLIHGIVKSAGELVTGAPVYLEAYDQPTRSRLAGLRTVRTGASGQYRFENLAPGTYRVLATFEYLLPDVETMESARAEQIDIGPKDDRLRDLELYVIR